MHLRPSAPQDEDIFREMASAGHDETLNPLPIVEQDLMDDVWDSDADHTASSAAEALGSGTNASAAHPSDIRRLQAEHTTAGYRDGITAAKAQSIQAGFDEGFGLGASIGLQAGHLLGVLEGIAAAAQGLGDEEGAVQVVKQLDEARGELSTAAIFGTEYWNGDGTWKWDVKKQQASADASASAMARDGGGLEDGDVIFADVAACHPLLQKWSSVVSAELARWNIDRAILEDVGEQSRAPTAPQRKEIQLETKAREVLEW